MLLLISTPIGNLSDLSPRATEMLGRADIIACEDTRQTRKLLSLSSITPSGRLVAYHDHNGEQMRPELLAEMTAGRLVALVSDAGTPLISDPGYKLVASCHEQGIQVSAVPGASAAIMALTISGLPSDQFAFMGFVPQKKKAAELAISQAASLPMTQIWFETAKRLAGSLASFSRIQGNRQAAITRELTKLYEEVDTGTLSGLAEKYALAPTPKGEIVLVISGSNKAEAVLDDNYIIQLLTEYLNHHSLRDAVRMVQDISGRKHKDIYQLALSLKDNS